MSFELPKPRTRKEYFMAIAAGGVPGTDFPIKYDVKPTVKHEDHTYSVTLESDEADSGYLYIANISDFVSPKMSSEEDLSVIINGKDAPYDEESGTWVNEDGYSFALILGGAEVWISSETELSGDALNVTVETSWDEIYSLVAQPRTIEEAYYAQLSQDYEGAVTFVPKTRKDKYLMALMDGVEESEANLPLNPGLA